MLARMGLFFWFMSVIAIVGYYTLDTRVYIELQSDEPSGIFIP